MGGNQNEGNAARNNGSCEKEGVDFQQANLSHLLLLCKINSHGPWSNLQQIADNRQPAAKMIMSKELLLLAAS
jgi:hypothetical protein